MHVARSRVRWAAGAAVLSLVSAGCRRGPAAAAPVDAAAAPVVGVARVEPQTLRRTLRLAAEFKPFQEIAVDAKVAGYVKTMDVDVGDHVRAGQLLAVLEVPELQDQIAQAQAELGQGREGVLQARDIQAQAQANYRANHLDFTRLSSVATEQPGLVAQQEVDDARGKDQAAQAQVQGAQAALAAAQARLDEAQANLRRLQTLFAYTRIAAPFSGVITQRLADTGAMIQAGTTQAMPLVKLAQEDVLRLGIPVPESAVPLIHLGMPAQVGVQALGQAFAGKVARFADQISFDTRTMYTEVDVPNPAGKLVPGMYADVVLELDRRPNVLAVPVQALHRQAGGATVLVVNARRQIEIRTVQLGLETPDAVEVLSGLHEGEAVVVGGASLLQPGEVVTPKTIDLASAAAGN